MPIHNIRELTPAELILAPAGQHWGMIMTLGILMIVLGTVGFFQPMVYTLATVVFFGALLLVAGGVGIVSAFKLRGWPGMPSGVVLAGLFILTGALMLMHPIITGLSLTLVIAAFLIACRRGEMLTGFHPSGAPWLGLDRRQRRYVHPARHAHFRGLSRFRPLGHRPFSSH